MVDYSVFNDVELIREYRSTLNQQIMAVLFTRYEDIGFRTAMRFVHNQADAEDILQTTYIHFLQNLDLFREGISIRSWLMKMIVNTCKNKIIEEKSRLKRQEKAASERFVQHEPEAPSSELESEKAELKELLRKNVDLLPEKYRSPIWLVLFEEVSYSEVATVLELPEKTIRTQVARGLEKLRLALSSYGSMLSISAILELIKETTLEKAPASISHLSSAPEIYQIALNSAKQKKMIIINQSYYSLKFLAIVIFSTIIAIFLFFYIRNAFVIENDLSQAVVQNKVSQEEIPMNLSLNFNKKSDIEPFVLVGDYNYVENGGLEKSGCIEVINKLILRFPVENVKIPLKLTFRKNLRNKIINDGYSFVAWDNWERMSVIFNLSPAILAIAGGGGEYIFTKDEDWTYDIIWITRTAIDFWCYNRRIKIYLIDQNYKNKYLYLNLVGDHKYENLTIQSVDEANVPDVAFFQKINQEVYQNSKEELTLIPQYFPKTTNDKLIPKHVRFDRFGAQKEEQVLQLLKEMNNK